MSALSAIIALCRAVVAKRIMVNFLGIIKTKNLLKSCGQKSPNMKENPQYAAVSVSRMIITQFSGTCQFPLNAILHRPARDEILTRHRTSSGSLYLNLNQRSCV